MRILPFCGVSKSAFKMHFNVLPLLAALPTIALAAPGDGDWAAAYAKAATALAKLTNANKVALATGIGWEKGPCVGNTGAVPIIGFPSLCLQDSPLGCVVHSELITICMCSYMFALGFDSLKALQLFLLGSQLGVLGTRL